MSGVQVFSALGPRLHADERDAADSITAGL